MTEELENQEVVEEPIEDVVDDSNDVEQPDEGTPDTGDNEIDEPQKDDGEEETPEFTLDEDGNLQWNLDDDKGDDDSPKQVSTETNGEQTPEPEPETNKEGEDEVYKVKVDGEEVEVTKEELLKGYMRQSDYTRKTQSLAQERKRLETPVNPAPPQYTQPQQTQQKQEPRQSTQELNEMAKSIAARNLGLASVDDLSELDFDHVSAVMDARNELRNQAYNMQRRQNSINSLEAQLRAEDPAYDTIMQNAPEKMNELPHGEFEKLREAYQNGDPEPLRGFYQKMAKDYYANAIKKADSKKKPVPKVESSNLITPRKVTKKVNFHNFSKLTSDQKAQALIDLGIV